MDRRDAQHRGPSCIQFWFVEVHVLFEVMGSLINFTDGTIEVVLILVDRTHVPRVRLEGGAAVEIPGSHGGRDASLHRDEWRQHAHC